MTERADQSQPVPTLELLLLEKIRKVEDMESDGTPATAIVWHCLCLEHPNSRMNGEVWQSYPIYTSDRITLICRGVASEVDPEPDAAPDPKASQ